ncbi:MAG TPA: tRNA 2-thiocytidine(32) synthetase TtcA [Firmicutes bacterium]|jgi:tRNA 2-thiocytidine biosynthesis protein TtcA|nr:tRNA 2-thiocytidine(32) synthetase TtcA [Candidatus Fermentithermobacillaceae bacterium]
MPKDPAWWLYRHLGQAVSDYSMIHPDDRILLGISGGKDSLFMAYALDRLRRRSPVKFDLAGITIDPGEPTGFTPSELESIRGFLESLDIPYHVVPSHIAKIVEQHPSSKTACSLCANLRRGALYKAANELGYKKVALAHHLDDAIETLFLNMFYQSNFRCFAPSTHLTRRDVVAIRPLIYIPEKEIARSVRRLGLPVIETRCPVAGTTCRQEMKDVVNLLAGRIPDLRNHMRSVLKDLWSANPSSVGQSDRGIG